MFFGKSKNTTPSFDDFELSPIDGIRWMNTEIYDKSGKDNKLQKTERTLQFRRKDGSWEDVWTNWNSPIYLDNKNG